ncbi:MAG TPA: cob(I)yrinic acid a,c-diamide adenosyltransferase [Bacillales bacterium]|nr:cob(I)yrinic acid a,c-diamide adenosyltransferase [Bacillales bacterium]
MNIYTKSGDKGTTALLYGKRVPKTDARVDAYGTCDEANSVIGVALSQLPENAFSGQEQFLNTFHKVQTMLFHVGAELSTPAGKKVHWPVSEDDVSFLEEAIDQWTETLPPLKKFILPGGSPAGASLHAARTVVRRAERKANLVGDEVNPLVLSYLNRLSDFLFVAARYLNHQLGRPESVLHDDLS